MFAKSRVSLAIRPGVPRLARLRTPVYRSRLARRDQERDSVRSYRTDFYHPELIRRSETKQSQSMFMAPK